MEWLNNTMVYWHWIVFGLLLVTLEMFIPVFVVLWLGIAAVFVGLLTALLNINVEMQLLTWAVLSFGLVLLWHKFISPKLRDKTTAGLSREAMQGKVGLVLEYQATQSRGRLRFPAPVLGNDEWSFICEDNISHGDKVEVIDISGNHVVVKPC